MSSWKHYTYECDFCVVGGGMAGTIAAITAARKGRKVVLVQDRPMLGGNASSEIRMQVRGAHGKENKETGILSEMELEAIYRNPTLNPTIWDGVIWEKVKAEKNITLLLNTSCIDVTMDGSSIASVLCWQLTTYSYHTVKAEYFADCSGDSVLAVPTQAEHRTGREAKSEYNESMGMEVADSKTMGMSILIQVRETDMPVPFIPPSWAYVYDDESFATIAYDEFHSSYRDHTLGTNGVNFWWIELGGHMNVLDDTEIVRDELIKTAYGVWDHIKNHGDHGAENWKLDWIGFLPGKRESRRYVGPYVLTQNDIQGNKNFDDVIAYGGWPLDDHNPMGFLNRGEAHEKSQFLPTPSPYQIPFRVLYSKNIDNLLFAGRNISATHAAISSTRVMGTCSLLGQALGTAVTICSREGIFPRELSAERITELQNMLLEDNIMLPTLVRTIPALTNGAKINLTDAQIATLQDGIERITADGIDHHIALDAGTDLEFRFEEPTAVEQLRVIFDPDYSRESITQFSRFQLFAMRSHVGKDFKAVTMPKNLAKSFTVSIDRGDGGWEEIYATQENRKDLFTLKIGERVVGVRLTCLESWGGSTINLYACDLA